MSRNHKHNPEAPSGVLQQCSQYHLVEQALLCIIKAQPTPLSLQVLASQLDISPLHLQHTFQCWAGLNPKQFLQPLTKKKVKNHLHESQSFLKSAQKSKLSNVSPLHNITSVTETHPQKEHKSRVNPTEILYGWHASPFGDCFIAVTQQGICQLAFSDVNDTRPLQRLSKLWPYASLINNVEITQSWRNKIFFPSCKQASLPLHIKGSRFQIKVWETLLSVPHSTLASYQQLAKAIGSPTASRAVGSSVGQNPVAWLIPCHRIVRSDGVLGGYHWGIARKQAMLLRELS